MSSPDPVQMLISTLVTTALGNVQKNMDMRVQNKYARRQAELQNARNLEIHKANQEKIRRDADRRERERKKALKRSLATQRARFGAGGVGSGSGSASALIQGLQSESHQAGWETQQDAKRALESNLNAYNYNRDKSLLEISEQKEQRRYDTVKQYAMPVVKTATSQFLNILEP